MGLSVKNWQQVPRCFQWNRARDFVIWGMTPEKLFHELLGLGLNWEVIESRFERESGTVFWNSGKASAVGSLAAPKTVDWFPAMTTLKC